MNRNTHTTDIRGMAEMLNIHPKTALELIQGGAVPAAKVGRAWVIMVKDVLTYLERQIVTQTAERMRRPTKESRPGRSL